MVYRLYVTPAYTVFLLRTVTFSFAESPASGKPSKGSKKSPASTSSKTNRSTRGTKQTPPSETSSRSSKSRSRQRTPDTYDDTPAPKKRATRRPGSAAASSEEDSATETPISGRPQKRSLSRKSSAKSDDSDRAKRPARGSIKVVLGGGRRSRDSRSQSTDGKVLFFVCLFVFYLFLFFNISIDSVCYSHHELAVNSSQSGL